MIEYEINVDKLMPICEGEEVTMIGPGGGFVYLWSNGETTPSITTDQAGIYSLTVTSNDGCQYIPETVVVNTIRPINPIITGFINDNFFEPESFHTEMEICQGESISLRTEFISGADYLWSTGETTYYLFSGLENLSVGEHIFTVNVTEPNFNCTIESEPFKVTVHPIPDAFQISSDQPDECQGPIFTFSVVNPDPSLSYSWNNGMTGTSISVAEPGIYYADAYNEFGCNRSSNFQSIISLPDISSMLTGCMESCFPDTLCVALSPSTSSYTWFLDGVEIPGSDQNELIINSIGDYQVELSNAAGCSVISENLTISPETKQQTISGKVYFDNNNNGVFDAGDDIISGASINIVSGGTILETQLTDADGNYLFDPAPTSAGEILLDTVGLNLNISSSSILLYSFEMNSCIEDVVQDFPCIGGACEIINLDVTLFTCSGESVEYECISYSAGTTQNISTFDNSGCETIVNLEVLPYPEINYQFTTFPTCGNVNGGVLSINIISGDDLQFSIDNGTNFSSNLEFYNLPGGNHSLIIMDSNGCTTTDNYTIPEFNSPIMTFNTNNICQGENNGSIVINSSASANMEFAVDDNSSYTNATTISNLSAGNHLLYVLDENGCLHEYDFSIEVFEEPDFTFDTYDSCTGHYLGALFIITSDLSLQFSLNGTDYSVQTDYLDLQVGNHTLYVKTGDNCVFTYPFTINSFGLINIDIVIKNTCAGSNNGQIEVINSTGLEFSLDGLDYLAGNGFSDLAAGDYTIFAQDQNQCPVTLPFTIEEIQRTELEFTEPIIDCQTEEIELEILSLNDVDLKFTWNNGVSVCAYQPLSPMYSLQNHKILIQSSGH